MFLTHSGFFNAYTIHLGWGDFGFTVLGGHSGDTTVVNNCDCLFVSAVLVVILPAAVVEVGIVPDECK